MRRHRSQFTEGCTEPQAIDPASGFKVPLSDLVKQWDGELIARKFVDRERNPQDYARGLPDRMALPFARPEAPDRFVSITMQYEDGSPIFLEDGSLLMTEGETVSL